MRPPSTTMADPSDVANAKLNAIALDDKKKGAVVHQFDPDASPDQKAATAGKTSLNFKPTIVQPDTKAVAINTSSSAPPPPTITIDDVDNVPPKEEEPQPPPPPVADEDQLPGTMPTKPAYVIPDWYRVGWRAVSGIDDPRRESELSIAKSAIEAHLSEIYYGQWYHNAAIIVFAVIFTHIFTLLRLGWGWLIVVIAFCSTYYQSSMQKFRRHARDDIQRELIKTRLATEHESADWLNNFLDRFWLIYEPILSKTITASVDQVLSASTPSFLDSIRLKDFTLGTKAPRIDKVRTFPRTEKDVVMMDWSIKFTPSDTTDVTPRQLASQVNPKIVLLVRVGKGLATAGIPILLEDMSFEGHMRIKLKLISNFPHIQTVEMCFIQPPTFDYVLKPIGGETFGWDVGNIPGLSAFIRDMVHATLQPMMYEPNTFSLNLEQLMSGVPLDAAVGVLQVHISSARNLKGAAIGTRTPDPYVSISINNRGQLAKTKSKASTASPHWGTSHFVLLNESNLHEILNLTVLDHNEHRKDTEIGAAAFELSSLLADGSQEGIIREVQKDGRERGELSFDLSYYPVLKPAIVDGKPEPLPETNVGICRLVLHQAKDLDNSASLSGDLNPFAKIFISSSSSGTPHHATKPFKHTRDPVWESATEFLVPNKKNSTVTIKVIDDRDFLKDPVIGYMVVRLEDLFAGSQKRAQGLGEPWYALSGCKTGKVRISAEWKPLSMAGGLQGAGSYVPPIGVVRLWLKKAQDVKNVEGTLGGKSDPYLRVVLNGIIEARTDIINNNLNPEWDQIVYVPVHSLRETMFLECMDYQNIGKDRPLGKVELRVSDLAAESTDRDTSDKYLYVSTGVKDTSSPIQVDKGVHKGVLFYSATFVPAMNLKGLAFEDEENELERAVHKGNHRSDGTNQDDVPSGDEESASSSDEENEKVPEGVTINPKRTHQRHTKNVKSVDTTATAKSTQTTDTISTSAEKQAGITLSKAELLTHQSGIVIFQVKSGTLAKKGRVEILLDDSYWPAFTTEHARSIHAKWDQVGEGFIKELDFSRVWIRLNENDEGEKEDIVGDLKLDAKLFLEDTLERPVEYELTTPDGRYSSKVTIAAKYVPVPVKIDPRESINNMGTLRVELLDGKDIHGADRSGKSDPFVVFTLNDNRVFKSEVQKKTLAPVWNQDFIVPVDSRVGASFVLEVFDWNQIEQAKSLGVGTIELTDLEAFQSLERVVTINSAKHGERGTIRLRLLFKPQIIDKTRKNTSTFSAAGRAMTQIGALPLGAGMGVAQGVGSVGKKALAVFGGRKDRVTDEQTLFEEISPSHSSSPILVQANGSSHALPSASPKGAPAALPAAESGTLKVSVIGAKDLSLHGESSVKPYLVLKCGKEEHKTRHTGKTLTPEWDETFSIPIGPETRTFNATIFDHKTLGRDKNLGEVDVDIWKHIQSSGTADLWLPLGENNGSLHLRLNFERSNKLTVDRIASNSSSRVVSSSRFSMTKRSEE